MPARLLGHTPTMRVTPRGMAMPETAPRFGRCSVRCKVGGEAKGTAASGDKMESGGLGVNITTDQIARGGGW